MAMVTAGPRSAFETPAALTAALALAAGAASLASGLDPDLLSGEPVIIGNLRGTAFVVAAVALPLLVAAAWLASCRDRLVALFVWFGVAGYLAYQGVMLCFATPMNALFLLYVSTLGLALWTIISLWDRVRVAGESRIPVGEVPNLPYRMVAVFLGVAALLNVAAWLLRVLPVMQTGELPQAVADSGLTTNPVLVQDLAFWLPAALVVSIATWRRSRTALLVAGGYLTFWVLEGLTVASDQFWGARADDGYPDLASFSVVPGALIVTGILAVPLVLLCRKVWALPDNEQRA
jgi:hypothetical protein